MGTGLHSAWMYVPVYMDVDRRRIVKTYVTYLDTLEVKTLHLWNTHSLLCSLDWLYSMNTTNPEVVRLLRTFLSERAPQYLGGSTFSLRN